MGLGEERADVTDPRVVARGRRAPRAERTASLSLDGAWDFHWAATHADAPEGFERTDFRPTASWGTITVPGVWETRGFGTPYYRGFSYPPAIRVDGRRLGTLDPDDSPTGSYRRTVTVPADWTGRRVILRFDGVKSAFHLWVNGLPIGYSEGSMTGGEFDITDAVTAGENLLAVRVHRFSTGTLLEDQDMWFFGGITRGVSLSAELPDAPWDVAVTTDFDAETGAGTLTIGVTDARGEVVVALAGREVARFPVSGSLTEHTIPVPGVRPWSAEHPHLYDLTVTTTTDAGTDERHLRIGFRRVRIVGEVLEVNGRAVKLHGVNRHDFDSRGIWDVAPDIRELDIVTMKRHNINAVRTSHYPNPDHLYRLCDEHGLYVIDEAEIESHGVRRRGVPGDDEKWWPSVRHRVDALVRRSRNHPSVILWSLGNEAGDGANLRRARDHIRALDASRPIHYEGDTTLEVSDVFSVMYPTPDRERLIGDGVDLTITALQNVLNRLAADHKPFPASVYLGRPVIVCEYAHAMGNSVGNLAEHVENFHRYPAFAGGFIWDWVDQTIALDLQNGDVRYGYGGDLGDPGSDGVFCANGLVASDRTPHPALAEVGRAYQHVLFAHSGSSLRITNRFAFDDLSGVVLRWEVHAPNTGNASTGTAPGTGTNSGRVADVTTSPGTTRTFDGILLPSDATLDVWLELTTPTTWAPAGYVIAREQFVSGRPGHRNPRAADGDWLVHERGPLVQLTRGDEQVSVDLAAGTISSLRRGDRELLRTPLSLNLWRVPTDNDRGLSNFRPALERFFVPLHWRAATADVRVARSRVTRTERGAEIELNLRAGAARGILRVTADGAVGVAVELEVTSRRPLLRVGLHAELTVTDADARWFGRGPHENYVDRRRSARLGEHAATSDELATDYPRPQENGLRTDVEWLKVADALTVEAITPFAFSLWPYSAAALEAAAHPDELARGSTTTLKLDIAHRGVGGDLPGELYLMPEYDLPAGVTVRGGFRLIAGPISPR